MNLRLTVTAEPTERPAVQPLTREHGDRVIALRAGIGATVHEVLETPTELQRQANGTAEGLVDT